MEQAVGLLEVYGLTCAFMAADAGCKAANVTLEDFDRNKPANAETLPVPLLITVKFRGSVSDVRAAMESAAECANALTGVVQSHVIPAPSPNAAKMLKISGFDKGSLPKKEKSAKEPAAKSAYGFFEVSGITAAVDALDIMCKTADIAFATWEKKLGGRLVTVIIKGDVSAVSQAIDTATRNCIKVPCVAAVLSNPDLCVVRLVEKSAAKYKVAEATDEVEAAEKEFSKIKPRKPRGK